MRIIQEVPLEPKVFQEIMFGESTLFLSAGCGPGGLSIFLEVDDEEPRDKPIGFFIFTANDPRFNDLPDNFNFVSTVQVMSKGELFSCHVYMEEIDFEMPEELY